MIIRVCGRGRSLSDATFALVLIIARGWLLKCAFALVAFALVALVFAFACAALALAFAFVFAFCAVTDTNSFAKGFILVVIGVTCGPFRGGALV